MIPGSPTEAWEADNFLALDKSNEHAGMAYAPSDFIITIVGNQLLYKGLWLEHAIVLQALVPLIKDFPNDGNTSSHLKLIILAGDSNINYSMAVEVKNLAIPRFFIHSFTLHTQEKKIFKFATLFWGR